MPPPVDVPERVAQVRELQLVDVVEEAQRRLRNEFVGREHPRGAVQHAGAQLRYLLVSELGVLRALGEQIHDIAQAQAEPVAQQNAMADDLRWERCPRQRNFSDPLLWARRNLLTVPFDVLPICSDTTLGTCAMTRSRVGDPKRRWSAG